jgi:hypothetical protein
MNVLERPDELFHAYEALRAQASGELPAATPRGLALFLAAGLPAWMKAWAPLTPPAPTTTAERSDHEAPVRLGGEVARLLTEMALGCQRGWATT